MLRERTESATIDRVVTLKVSVITFSLSTLSVSDEPILSVVSSHDTTKRAASIKPAKYFMLIVFAKMVLLVKPFKSVCHSMYGLQLLVEFLVCHGVVFAGVGKNRYAFALGICN